MNPIKPYALFLLLLAIAPAQGETTWSIDTQEEWEKSIASKSGLELINGMADPSGKEASIQSEIKRFETKQSAKSILIEQSPVWLNWEKTKNMGPASMRGAPVLLSLGADNYWMFGTYAKRSKKKNSTEKKEFQPKSAELEGFDIPLVTTEHKNQFKAPGGLKPSLGGYHAWQSRDMKNWVHHGPITETFSKWMTTAEYVDGKFYFYYDFPNDQDPHVYVDEDLTDGLPGENKGIAFKDPSHGSDCAIIRDKDGKFHLIYENWDPINAKTHAWDSPLAGHSISEDGLKDFKILDPAVDVRTKPTGEFATYTHPHWNKEDPENFKTNEAKYEVHHPEQNAFGDWAAISIGDQYYLFADYDPADRENMSTAWFTSSSLDEQFEFCGDIGTGHPDPDICFAEGQFYLVTQQPGDFTSPGPWVETVEVRVGVDTDNDEKIDQWTDWQKVTESYDHTPNFAKQISKTPASIDLSSLPEGYGFQFDIRMTDSTENQSKPILDKVSMSFGK